MATNDEGTGSGNVQIFVNDPPSFSTVYEGTEWITPLENVTFWAIIVDIDNTSGELTTTIYYSNDSFVSHNESVTMSYNDTISADTYRFIYEWEGESSNTYYDYYYQVFDGENIVQETNGGLYYNIQWGLYRQREEWTAWDPFPASDNFTAKFRAALPGLLLAILLAGLLYKFFKGLITHA